MFSADFSCRESDCSHSNDSGMYDIIGEESGAYFEKDKDAAAAAGIIQNRVGIYQ